jgi:DNA-binding CsgD family transcriptional regulator
MKPGASQSDLCKFLVLETFADLNVSSIYTAEITDDGYMSPVATFGIPTKVLSGWGNISLSVEAPCSDAIKKDQLLLFTKADLLEKYPNLAYYKEFPQKWESYLVCPVIPHGLFALTLDTTPKMDDNFELLLRTVGSIMMHHFNCCQHQQGDVKNRYRDNSNKKLGGLTERQVSIKHLMEKGLTNPAIAQEIGYSESLVRSETMAIYSALNISGRKELIDRKLD